jgi:drug/metabolite transporter (DMT)-like permease
VVAVLTSIYPATTVVLAKIVLEERIAGLQWVGVGLCLIAIELISL